MPIDIMQSLKFMPMAALIILAAVFLVFVIYAIAKSKEVGEFRKKYMSFASRDMFIEDVINSLNRRTIHTFMLFLALIITVFVSGAVIGSKEVALSGPGGVEELDAKYSAMKQDYDILKEEKERLASRFASLTKTADADAAERQLSENYRAALVNYYYLLKCNSSNVYDGMALISMLSMELSRIGAPSIIIWATVDEARNLYNREYSKNNCDKAAIEQIRNNQKQFIDSATKNVQAALSFTPPNLNSIVSPEAALSGELDLTKAAQQPASPVAQPETAIPSASPVSEPENAPPAATPEIELPVANPEGSPKP